MCFVYDDSECSLYTTMTTLTFTSVRDDIWVLLLVVSGCGRAIMEDGGWHHHFGGVGDCGVTVCVVPLATPQPVVVPQPQEDTHQNQHQEEARQYPQHHPHHTTHHPTHTRRLALSWGRLHCSCQHHNTTAVRVLDIFIFSSSPEGFAFIYLSFSLRSYFSNAMCSGS